MNSPVPTLVTIYFTEGGPQSSTVHQTQITIDNIKTTTLWDTKNHLLATFDPMSTILGKMGLNYGFMRHFDDKSIQSNWINEGLTWENLAFLIQQGQSSLSFYSAESRDATIFLKTISFDFKQKTRSFKGSRKEFEKANSKKVQKQFVDFLKSLLENENISLKQTGGIIDKITKELKKGLDPNFIFELSPGNELTPLIFAVTKNHRELIELLITAGGALIDFRGSDGKTPLHVCATLGQTSLLHYFIPSVNDRNISLANATWVDAPDASGLTPLFFACMKSTNNEFVQKLLAAGANPNSVDPSTGKTPLHQACTASSEQIITYLLQAGSNINALNSVESTPLHTAVASEYPIAVVKTLLKFGADRSIKNKSGQTPLQLAMVFGKQDVISLLKSFTDEMIVPLDFKKPSLEKSSQQPFQQQQQQPYSSATLRNNPSQILGGGANNRESCKSNTQLSPSTAKSFFPGIEKASSGSTGNISFSLKGSTNSLLPPPPPDFGTVRISSPLASNASNPLSGLFNNNDDIRISKDINNNSSSINNLPQQLPSPSFFPTATAFLGEPTSSSSFLSSPPPSFSIFPAAVATNNRSEEIPRSQLRHKDSLNESFAFLADLPPLSPPKTLNNFLNAPPPTFQLQPHQSLVEDSKFLEKAFPAPPPAGFIKQDNSNTSIEAIPLPLPTSFNSTLFPTPPIESNQSNFTSATSFPPPSLDPFPAPPPSVSWQ